MFAYCLNNPVNFGDPSGMYSSCLVFVKCLTDGGGTSANPHNVRYPFTASMGVELSGGIGPLTASLQVSIVSDSSGNSELQIGFSPPSIFSTGLPSVDEMFADILSNDPQYRFGGSIAATMSFTNAPDVEKVRGLTHSVGGSIPGLAISSNYIPDSEDPNRAYQGITFASGLITPGINYTPSYSIPVISLPFNVFDLAELAYKGWLGG